MIDNTILPFSFPAVARKKITAAFDGGRLTSNGGVMLLALADRRIGVARKLSCVFPERRDPTRIVHSLADMIRARIFAIACGYEDGNDLDHLRSDPAFKLACGRLADTGRDLCSQPTVSRLENAPHLREAIRLSYALVEIWMDSYERAPSAVTLDIDDTVDVVHGRQQLSLFNAYYDEHCFLPIHVYDTERSRPVAVVLRPAQNAEWHRGTRASAPPGSAHSPTLAQHAHHLPGRQPLRLPRGDGLVRAEPSPSNAFAKSDPESGKKAEAVARASPNGGEAPKPAVTPVVTAAGVAPGRAPYPCSMLQYPFRQHG